MSTVLNVSSLAAALLASTWLLPIDAAASKRTVCTITVNSPDEQATFRRYLPNDDYRFVELVERGRKDWLASACRKDVRCDVLVISGHFNGHDFFSDQLLVDEYLPVEEMERVSCSNSCPGLFSQLKEVYLFGCTTLSPDPSARDTAELVRSLERSGHSRAEAERTARQLVEQHAETNRDVMRRVFPNVPAIYGFSAVAPLGNAAAPLLARYFEGGGARSVGSGRPDGRLLRHFSAHNMAVTGGSGTAGREGTYRREMCEFVDERLAPAEKLRFVHALLRRDSAEARLYFDRIEHLLASLTDSDLGSPEASAALRDIAQDAQARERYLVFARDADRAVTRVRMIRVAGKLGWLSEAEERTELAAMVRDLLAGSPVSTTDVGLVCQVNARGELDGAAAELAGASAAQQRLDHAAVLACLGSKPHHASVLGGLASPRAEDVAIAEVYLHERPLSDPAEVRAVVTAVASMPASATQVRALDVLARQHLADAASARVLAELFTRTRSVDVQRAVAGIFVRADAEALTAPEIAGALRERRLAPKADDVVEVALRRVGDGVPGGESDASIPPLEASAAPWTRARPTASRPPAFE